MGEWVERDPGYLSFEVQNCTYCGKLIPRHIWYEEIDDQRRPYCNPDCFRRYAQRRGYTTREIIDDTDTG
jgi:hypothetical protein